MIKLISNIFLKGFGIVLPLFLTLYFFYWVGISLEVLVRDGVQSLLGERLYFPGLGILLILAVVFFIGILMHFWFFNKFIQLGEYLINKLPLVKSVYSSLNDIFSFLIGSHHKNFNQVVMVQSPKGDLKLIGFVTREVFSDLPKGIGDKSTVALYLPMSYQIGGYMVLVPRSWITPIKMSMEEALKFTLTAGVSKKKKPRNLA